MPKFEIFAGLGNGFGGAQSCGIIDCADTIEAEQIAYNYAIEEYESYCGYYGILDPEGVREDLANSFYDGDLEAVPEDEIEDTYQDLVDSWIEYYTEEIT